MAAAWTVNRSDQEDAWKSESGEFVIESLLQQGSFSSDRYTICNQNYTCVDGPTPMWVESAKVEDGANIGSACVVDSLVAAAKALPSCKVPNNIPDQCKIHNGTILLNKPNSDNTHMAYIFPQEGGEGNPMLPRLPTHIEAGVTCSPHLLNEDDYIVDPKVPAVRIESLMRVDFVKNVRVNDTPPILTPPAQSPPQSPPPLQPPPLQPPPQSTPPPTNNFDFLWGNSDDAFSFNEREESTSAWRTCHWGDVVKINCREDSDCPLPNAIAFDAWFAGTFGALPNDKLSIDSAIEIANKGASKTQLNLPRDILDADGRQTGIFASRTKVELRSILEQHYRVNDEFQSGVRTMIESEKGKYSPFVNVERKGACNANSKCSFADDFPKTTSLFSGDTTKEFFFDDSQTLVMLSGGSTLPVNAVDCSKDTCSSDKKSISVAAENGRVRLEAGQPVSDSYRMTFGDREFLITNQVQVLKNGSTGRCDEALCKAYSDTCPTSHCQTTDTGSCNVR